MVESVKLCTSHAPFTELSVEGSEKRRLSFLGDMLADRDVEKANRVMKAIMKMDKIDIGALEQAAKGG
ncbi:MAG: hypothetical protein DMF01_09905 [Verrucomicrobia bacterium]|nr:MAG: hypothetical protein DMF01_09905 [Verrucomicrobiota bacterium]